MWGESACVTEGEALLAIANLASDGLGFSRFSWHRLLHSGSHRSMLLNQYGLVDEHLSLVTVLPLNAVAA